MIRPAALFLLAFLVQACTLVPPESEHIRARQMEDAVLPMAATALETGQLETARRLYRRLLDVDPESVPARMGLGDVALRERETEAAARWYLSALTRAGQPAERHAALLAHGRAALAAGRLEAASESFSRLTHPDENAPRPSVAWGYNGKGLALLLEGDPQGAVTAMEQAVLRAPQEQRFQANLNRALAILSDTPAPPARPPEPGPEPAPEPGPQEPESPDAQIPTAPPEIPAAKPVEAATAGPDDSTGAASPSSSVLVVIENGLSHLQFGAYADRANAAAEAASVSDLLERPANIHDLEDGEGASLHRVRIGPLQSGNELLNLIELVEAHGFSVANPPRPQAENQDGPPAAPYGMKALLVSDDEGQYVQAGAYSEREMAEQRAEELRGLTDRPVRVSELSRPDAPTLHRVRIGPVEPDDPLLELFDFED